MGHHPQKFRLFVGLIRVSTDNCGTPARARRFPWGVRANARPETARRRKVLYLCPDASAPPLRRVRATFTIHKVCRASGETTLQAMTAPAPTSVEETRARVISAASAAFRERGIKGVTMDDVSHMLGMSKRTLYQVFRDKEDLLLACVQRHEAEVDRRLSEAAAQAGNVLELVLLVFKMKMEEMEGKTFGFFTDILKYPKVEAHLRQGRKRQERLAVDFLSSGIKEGVFLPSVDFSIVYNHLMEGMEALMRNPEMHSRGEREIFVNTAVVTIRGCATPRGVEMIDAFMRQFGR